MKYYPWSDEEENLENLALLSSRPLELDETGKVHLLRKALPVAEWFPNEVLFKLSTDGGDELTDFLCNTFGLLIISERLKKFLLKPVVLGTVIAIPLGYYAMYTRLQNFAYRTTLDWWIFLLAAAITIAIALRAVSFKAIKAALAKPVNSLSSE